MVCKYRASGTPTVTLRQSVGLANLLRLLESVAIRLVTVITLSDLDRHLYTVGPHSSYIRKLVF